MGTAIKQWSPAKFKVLANFLVEQYGEKGVSVSELVQRQIDKAKRNGRNLTWDEAYEEMVADSMEAILTDGNVVQMMADLKQQDKTLWQKICDWFKDLTSDLKKLVEAYKGYKPDSPEGKMVADMQDTIVIFESIYADALAEASENFQRAEKNTTKDGDVKFSQREFNKDVDSIVYSDDNAPFDYRNVFMGETPQTLLDVGFIQLPMTITSKHIYTIANKEGRFASPNDHYHELGATMVKELPDMVKEAVATFIEKDKPRRVVIVTSRVDSHGQPIMVAVEYSGQTRYKTPTNEVQIYSNPVTTALGKKDSWFLTQIEEAVRDGRMLRADKKRSQESPSGVWAQCPESLWSSDFTTNIERFKQNVKRFLPKEKQIRKSWGAVKEVKEKAKNLKFSDRDQAAGRVNEVLQNENAKLKEDVQYLKDLVKIQKTVTGGTKFTKTSVEAMAGNLMKANNARGNKTELTKLLNELYEYIAKGEELSWDGVKEMAQPAVDWLKNHTVIKSEISEYAREILHDVRTSRISLDESQTAEAAYRFGSYNDFRKAMMGSVIVSKDGVPLDIQWQEWSGMYPDIFDANTTASDMPGALADAISSLRNSDLSRAEYAYHADMIEQDLLQQVYDGYWRVSTLYTVADVKQREISSLKGKHRQQMNDLRQFHREKTDQLKREHRDEVKRIRKEYREDSQKKQREIMDRYEESRKRSVENRNKTAMRHKIQNVVKELNSLLLTNDTNYRVVA